MNATIKLETLQTRLEESTADINTYLERFIANYPVTDRRSMRTLTDDLLLDMDFLLDIKRYTEILLSIHLLESK